MEHEDKQQYVDDITQKLGHFRVQLLVHHPAKPSSNFPDDPFTDNKDDQRRNDC